MKLSDLLRDFVNERFILSLIIVNSFVIFLQCYPNAPFALVWVDACFTLTFVLEALVKIGLDGFVRYWKDRWNRFDFIITLLSLPSLLQLFDMPEVLSTFSAVLALRLFRLLRLLKTLRILKSIPEVVSLLSGIKRALVVSHVIFYVFLLFLIVSSLISCVLFSSYSPELFGTPFRAIYSTFRLFTLEGWYEIPDALATAVGGVWATWVKVYFTALLFFGGIIGMSFLNSIIVDAMVADNNDALERKVDDLTRLVEELNQKIDTLKNAEAPCCDEEDDPDAPSV